MKLSLLFLTLATTTTSQLLHPLLYPSNQQLEDHHPDQYQTSMSTSTTIGKPPGPPLLADVLPLDKSISVFSGFTRSVESISTRVSDREKNTTVLAPTNYAISKLPRKPWESPDDEDAGGNVLSEIYKGLGGEDRAGRNLRRFVEAHCLAENPWGEGVKVETLAGKVVWWTWEGGVKKIFPDGIEVEERMNEASNGQVWILKGVINY
jgi:hypothetical protein